MAEGLGQAVGLGVLCRGIVAPAWVVWELLQARFLEASALVCSGFVAKDCGSAGPGRQCPFDPLFAPGT